jgi:hypothetical protein
MMRKVFLLAIVLIGFGLVFVLAANPKPINTIAKRNTFLIIIPPIQTH